tara:strand:+ start:10558 stop:11166 length:609 start_codon:yes stop_codon:yes gene_type:complete
MRRESFGNYFSITLIPTVVIFISIILLSIKAGIEPELVLRDIIQTCSLPIGVGMISNIGIILWASSSAIAVFTSLNLSSNKNRAKNLLLMGGIFSAMLCLDDLFLLHDRHISPYLLYISYAIIASIMLSYYYKLIFSIDKIAFISAIIFLGLSIFSDLLQWILPFGYKNVQIFEEGFKFLGITSWFTFWVKGSSNILNKQNN